MTALSIEQTFTAPSDSAQTADSEIDCSCSKPVIGGSLLTFKASGAACLRPAHVFCG